MIPQTQPTSQGFAVAMQPNGGIGIMPVQMQVSQKITLGPIIGKVTYDSARVLVEYAYNATETLSLIAPNGSKVDCQRQVIANRPVVFEFRGLSPKTIYKVVSASPFPAGDSSFRTLDTKAAPTNFAFVSCNSRKTYEKYTDERNLWSDVSRRAVNKELDYIIHTGDQVYMDYYNNIYDRCMELIKKTPQNAWSQIVEEVREILRAECRLTFGGKLQAIAMANSPNIMQYDDHDARDDLGFRKEDKDPSTPDGFYVQQARWVYYEYQRQLREDIDFSKLDSIKYEFHAHILNNIGIFILDYRGKNSWLRAPETGQLGTLQWEALKRVFKPHGGDFDKCELAILVSPLAFVLFSQGWTGIIGKFIDDARENWAYNNQKEQIELMNLLDDWKIAKKGKRDLFIVAGDVHMSGHTDIFRDGRRAFGQVVTSGICQEPPADYTMIFSKIAEGTSQKLQDGWTFDHHGWSLRNNYAIVSVKSLAMTPVYTVRTITTELKGAIKEEPIVEYSGKIVKQAKSNGCCTIF